MRYLKTLGVALVAAAALTAVVGAGAAQAETTLCKNTETPCAAGNGYGVGTSVEASLESGTEAILTAGGEFLQTNCKSSEVAGKLETATTPSGKLSKLSFTNCNRTVTTKKPGEITLHWDAEHNGNLTAKGFQIEVTAGVTCIFGGEVKSGLTVTGGSPAKLDATATIPKESGSIFCPSSAVWHATYILNSPKPAYVSNGV
jgi:hypothetical protein